MKKITFFLIHRRSRGASLVRELSPGWNSQPHFRSDLYAGFRLHQQHYQGQYDRGEVDLIDLVGGATVTPDDTNTAMIAITGDYAADAGDIFSVAYSFTVDLNTTSPVELHFVRERNRPRHAESNLAPTAPSCLACIVYEGAIEIARQFPAPRHGNIRRYVRVRF